MMQYNKSYSFEKTDVRGLFYFNFFKRNVQSKHVCQLAYNGSSIAAVAKLELQNFKLRTNEQ